MTGRKLNKVILVVFMVIGLTTLNTPALDTMQLNAAAYVNTSQASEQARIQTQINNSGGYASGAGRQAVVKEMLDTNALILQGETAPFNALIRRANRLLADVRNMPGVRDLTKEADTLLQIKNAGASQFAAAYALQRKIALANPSCAFDSVICITALAQGCHLQCWGKGYMAPAGGGMYLVTGIHSGTISVKNMLSNAVVQNGPLAGHKLTEYTQSALYGLDVDYDGKTIAFAWVQQAGLRGWRGECKNGEFPACTTWAFDPASCFHIFTMKTDGSQLTQLTQGRRNDIHPCFLPNGRIVFISDRFGFQARCLATEFMPCGALWSMQKDGSDVIPISYHETTELFPSVCNDGMLVYTRWDYIDRDWSAAHNLWRCYPDGRDARAPHGNYPYPWEPGGSGVDGRADRPWVETGIRAIPGSYSKYVAIATTHHGDGASEDRGSLVTIDLNIADDNKMSQARRFEPVAFVDESCRDHGATDAFLSTENPAWADPWPLGDGYVMAGQGTNAFLVDKFGDKDWIFSIPTEMNPAYNVRFARPLQARAMPPDLSTMTYQGARYKSPDHKAATLGIVNIYKSDIPFPAGTKIKALRVFQLIARPWEYTFNEFPGRVNGRMLLGTVPVENDGSAYFLAPVEKSLYFQAVDSSGCAVQSMRSAAFVHPGEQLQCIGCHENKWEAVPPGNPMAFRRAPSPLTPNLQDGSCPISYARLVQPILAGRGAGLTIPEWHLDGGTSGCWGVDRDGYRSIPGKVGAHAVGLDSILFKEPWKSKLTQEDTRRLLLWVDALSMRYTANFNYATQDAGGVVWPNHEVDPANPAGTEDKYGFAIPGAVTTSVSDHPSFAPRQMGIIKAISRGKITIINNTAEMVQAWLYTVQGKVVWRSALSPDKTITAVLQNRLNKGLYLLRITRPSGTQAEPVMVLR
ncbi:MAG: hypothetical protein PHC61_11285 [Chitinivibrionales bacterium]|nr:hypothetical protein [Chitinivibrionales bacterium]